MTRELELFHTWMWSLDGLAAGNTDTSVVRCDIVYTLTLTFFSAIWVQMSTVSVTKLCVPPPLTVQFYSSSVCFLKRSSNGVFSSSRPATSWMSFTHMAGHFVPWLASPHPPPSSDLIWVYWLTQS